MNRPRILTLLMTGFILALVFTAGTATGAKLITGNDIKDGTITTKDVKDNSLKSADIKDNSLKSKDVKDGTLASGDIKDGTIASGDIKDGSIGAGDLSQAAKDSLATSFSGPGWGVVDRNVIGNGDSDLRAGPVVAGPDEPPFAPPFGIGSLGIRTGSGEDKAAFGNQVDFAGAPLSEISELGYWVATTSENRAANPANLPNLQFEIDAKLTGPPVVDFTTANHIAPAVLPGWHQIDAVATGEWFLSGTEGDDTGCNQTTTCTLAELQAAVPDATILTVQINKGRDFAFSGAVDGLQINDDVYDFEPLGVTITSAP